MQCKFKFYEHPDFMDTVYDKSGKSSLSYEAKWQSRVACISVLEKRWSVRKVLKELVWIVILFQVVLSILRELCTHILTQND